MATLLFSAIILLLKAQFTLASAAVIHGSPTVNCPTKCGNVDISHPFGIGKGCYLEGFEVICNQSIPYLSKPNLQLLEILDHEVLVKSTNFIAKTCFSEDERTGRAEIKLPEESPYSISYISNILVGIGCEMSGLLSSPDQYGTSCALFCPTDESMGNGSCNGIGCCQMHLPPLGKNLLIQVHQYEPSINNCSYAFIIETGTYIFNESDLSDFYTRADISMRLEWLLPMKFWRCSITKTTLCGANTQCKDTANGSFCTCLQGFEGKPYHYSFYGYGSIGCQVINECNEFVGSGPCVPEAKCWNEVPGFRCECPIGISGDGQKEGNDCNKKDPYSKAAFGN